MSGSKRPLNLSDCSRYYDPFVTATEYSLFHFWRIFRSWSNCVWFLTLLNANSPTPIYTCITVFVTKERNTCHSLEGSVIQYCN